MSAYSELISYIDTIAIINTHCHNCRSFLLGLVP